MIRKLFCAMFVMTLAVGFVLAEEFNATITKVDGNKITYQKFKKVNKKAEKDGDPVTATVTKDATIANGKGLGKGKYEAGDKIDGGLKADVFSTITAKKGVSAHITTDGDKVTQILVLTKKKKAAN